MPSGRPIDRRLFLALGAVAIPIGVAACSAEPSSPAVPRPAGTEPPGSLQQMIDSARARGGGVVTVAASSVFVETGVSLPDGVDLEIRGIVRRARGSTTPLVTITGEDRTVRGFPGGFLDGNRGEAGQESDVIRVRGSRSTLTGLTVRDSPSNGIGIFSSAENRVESCEITNSRNNGIIVANQGADANVVVGNHVVGTSQQNGIFITASAGSTATGDSIRDNQVVNNDVSAVGDTGIESGIHTVNTLVSGNRVVAARNPGILLRDCTGVQVLGNTVRTTEGTIDAYAIVPQTQPSDVAVDSVFADCTVIGNAKRSGFYVNSNGVAIRRARLMAADPPGDLRGNAILTGAIRDVDVVEPVVDSWQTAFTLNDASTEATLTAIRVVAPRVSHVGYVYSAVGAHLVDCEFDMGQLDDVTEGLFQRNGLTSLEGSSRIIPPAAGALLASGVDASLPGGPGGN